MTFNKNIIKLLTAAFILGVFLYLCIRVNFIQDDSYISLQYANNLLEGKGLVFNSGHKVEGFTSFIWILILTIPYLIKISPELFIQSVSIIFGELCLLMTYLISEEIIPDFLSNNKHGSIWSFLPVGMLGVSGTFYYWSVSGMETTFFTFLCLTGLLYYLKRREKFNYIYFSITFLTLAFLTRQEAILIVVILLLQFFITDLRSTDKNFDFRSILSSQGAKAFSIFFITALLFLFLRYFYFGYLLPNTFYAKTGTSFDYLKSGIQYTVSFYRDYLLYGVSFFCLSLLMFRKVKISSISLLYSVIIIYTIYIILVGGDVLALHRFFIPILPLLYILFTVFIILLYNFVGRIFKNRTIFKPVYAFLVLILITTVFFNNFSDSLRMSTRENGFTNKMKVIASVLKKETAKTEKRLLVAACTVGNLKYFAGCDVLDMLGLTDEYIAHNSSYINLINDYETGWKERNFNTDYVLSRKPDYIIFSTEDKPSSFAERALFTKEEFLTHYIVYPFLVDSFEIPFYVYKRLPENIIKAFNIKIQNNAHYSPSFVNDYNLFLNQINQKTITDNFSKITMDFNNLVKKSPSYFGEPYRFMAIAYYQRGDTVNAMDYLRRCIQLDSTNLIARIILYTIADPKKWKTLILLQQNYIRNYYPEIYAKLNHLN